MPWFCLVRARALAATFVCSVALVVLGACRGTEVRPLYAERAVGVMASALDAPHATRAFPSPSDGTDLRNAALMAGDGIPPLAIPQLDGRDGQLMHNALRDRLAPLGLPDDPAFELVVQSFSVTQVGIQDQVGGAQTLSAFRVNLGFRVNRIGAEGARTLAFADSVVVSHSFNAPPDGSVYVTDPRVTLARRAAIAQAAQAAEAKLRLQFARLAFDARNPQPQ